MALNVDFPTLNRVLGEIRNSAIFETAEHSHGLQDIATLLGLQGHVSLLKGEVVVLVWETFFPATCINFITSTPVNNADLYIDVQAQALYYSSLSVHGYNLIL